jgi:hypothetical protein
MMNESMNSWYSGMGSGNWTSILLILVVVVVIVAAFVSFRKK